MTPECCSTQSSPSPTTQRDTPPTTMLGHSFSQYCSSNWVTDSTVIPPQIRPSDIWRFCSTRSMQRKADSETFSATIAGGTKLQGSEDCHGRALWGLGTVLGRSKNQGLRCAAGRLFELSLPAVMEFNSPRAWAYALLGIQEYLDSYPGDRDAQKIRSVLSTRLLEMYRSVQTSDWKWFENILAYGNARLPQALLLVGSACSNDRMVSAGLEALDWLLKTQHCEANGHFVPIGSDGFYRYDGEKARFDQQPLEAAGAVSACLQAYRVTGNARWRNEAWSAFNWFLGDNDLQLPLYDSVTGGCRDGLHPDRANENQGAESTLSFLMALLEMSSLPEPDSSGTSGELFVASTK